MVASFVLQTCHVSNAAIEAGIHAALESESRDTASIPRDEDRRSQYTPIVATLLIQNDSWAISQLTPHGDRYDAGPPILGIR